MVERQFLSGHEDFNLSRQLAAKIFRDGFIPDLVYGVWKGGTPAAVTVHDTFKALARFLGFPEPRYHNAVKAEADGTVDSANLAPLLEQVRDGDKVLVVGNVHKNAKTLEAITSEIHGKATDLDVRSAVQVYRPNGSGQPNYFAMETGNHVVFPYQMDGLTDDEIREHRPEVAGFLLDDDPIMVPTGPAGVQEKGLLFVTDEIYRLSRELAVKAYLDGVRPTLVLGVWRGGTPIAIAVYDMFVALAERKDFAPPRMSNVLRAQSYDLTGAGEGVRLQNLPPVLKGLEKGDEVLKIDDVFERGTTDEEIRSRARGYSLSTWGTELKFHGYDLVAKPEKVLVNRKQDGTLYTCTGNLWFVFPYDTTDWAFDNVGTKDSPQYKMKESALPLIQTYRPHLAELFQPR